MTAPLDLPDGRSVALDGEGYLEDWTAWDRSVAEGLAARDGLTLEAAHWDVIDLLRAHYARYEIAPPMRALLKLLRRELDDETLNSRHLYRLFPGGPAKQACRYAGLPRPVSCI